MPVLVWWLGDEIRHAAELDWGHQSPGLSLNMCCRDYAKLCQLFWPFICQIEGALLCGTNNEACINGTKLASCICRTLFLCLPSGMLAVYLQKSPSIQFQVAQCYAWGGIVSNGVPCCLRVESAPVGEQWTHHSRLWYCFLSLQGQWLLLALQQESCASAHWPLKGPSHSVWTRMCLPLTCLSCSGRLPSDFWQKL